MENNNFIESKLVSPELSNNPTFQTEVFTAILKIILIPDCFIQKLAHAFIPVVTSRYIDALTSRRDTLEVEAKKVSGFINFLQSTAAESEIKQHYTHLRKFKVNINHRLFAKDEVKLLKDSIQEKIAKVLSNPTPTPSTGPGLFNPANKNGMQTVSSTSQTEPNTASNPLLHH